LPKLSGAAPRSPDPRDGSGSARDQARPVPSAGCRREQAAWHAGASRPMAKNWPAHPGYAQAVACRSVRCGYSGSRVRVASVLLGSECDDEVTRMTSDHCTVRRLTPCPCRPAQPRSLFPEHGGRKRAATATDGERI